MEVLSSKRRRRGLQFSLRSLVLLTTVLAVWLGLELQRAREQEEIVKIVTELGGSVCYDHESSKCGTLSDQWKIPGFRRLVGDYPFVNVVGVVLSGDEVTDRHIEKLKVLTDLRQIVVWDATLTDAGLQQLAELQTLKNVDVRGTRVSSEGVRRLQRALPACQIEYHATTRPPHPLH